LPGTKIKKIDGLKKEISRLKKSGKRVVFTNGCFDLLHYGHVMYLEKAKSLGDVLVVGLNSDASVRRIKGSRRPLINQNDRARIIAALESVDFVVIFGSDTPLEAIKALKPDLLVKGSDWKNKGIVGAEFIKNYGGRVLTVKLADGRSTSSLIKTIVERYR